MNQTELAKELGVSKQQVSKYKNNGWLVYNDDDSINLEKTKKVIENQRSYSSGGKGGSFMMQQKQKAESSAARIEDIADDDSLGGGADLLLWKIRNEKATALKKEIELEEIKGSLISKSLHVMFFSKYSDK